MNAARGLSSRGKSFDIVEDANRVSIDNGDGSCGVEMSGRGSAAASGLTAYEAGPAEEVVFTEVGGAIDGVDDIAESTSRCPLLNFLEDMEDFHLQKRP